MQKKISKLLLRFVDAIFTKDIGNRKKLRFITGHLPREISRVTKFLLDRGAVAYTELTSTHYRRSPIMQGGLEIPCKITLKLHNHMLLDRYLQLVNSLYCEPKAEVIMGSFLTKTQFLHFYLHRELQHLQ